MAPGRAAAGGHVVDPLVLAARGAQVLHASAVLAGGRLVALAGPSGAGKSTLAAAWREQDPAAVVVADDALVIESRGETAEAVWSGARAPLAAIFLLARGEAAPTGETGAAIEPVAAGEAFAALLSEAFCATLDASSLRRIAAGTLDLLSRVPVRRLRYASGRERLPGVVAAIAGAAGGVRVRAT